MSHKKKKEICLWLVPTETGKVRKIRVSLFGAGLLFLSVISISGVVAFVLSDYGRIQISRHLTRNLLGAVTSERNELMSKNDELANQVEDLKTTQTQVLSYKEQISKRIKVLTSILQSSSPFDPFHQGQKKAQVEKRPVLGGVGGLEIDCGAPGAQAKCGDDRRARADFKAFLNGSLGDKNTDGPVDQNFIRNLDAYIQVLETLPVGKPSDGEINSAYGIRRSPFTHRLSKHEGVDISMHYGSQIFSTAQGIVTRVQRTPTYGLVVDIEHSTRVSTRYAHMSKALVKPGQTISRGDVIGLVGSSGRSTGPHVHYEVRLDGEAIDPSDLVDLADKFDPTILAMK